MTDNHQTSSIQRVFLGWDGPALPRAAEVLAESYFGSAEMDLREVVVVTPAARAGRRLGELLLDQAEGRGVPLTPPTLVTMGRFPELLYRPRRPLADSTATRHAFLRALMSVDPETLGAVFPVRPQSMSGWMTLAGVVESLHREVGAEGLDFGEVARAFRRGFPYDDSIRWDVLARLQSEYHATLASVGLADRDGERKGALAGGLQAFPRDIWLVGVVELPGMVRRMLELLPGTVRALIHAPEELRDRFDELGCVLPSLWGPAHIPLRDEQIRVVQRPPDQADAVAGILRGFQGRFGAEEIVVGVPDPELVPYVERGLSMADLPHRFAGGTPLADSGPLRLLRALADYLDGRPYPAFAALIRHPDLHHLLDQAGPGPHDLAEMGGPAYKEVPEEGGADPEVTGPLTAADQYQSRHLQSTVEGPLPGEDKYAVRMRGLVRQLEERLGLEAFQGGGRRISEWMPAVLEVLVRVYGAGLLQPGSRRMRQRVEVLTRIRGAAGRLALLPGVLDAGVAGAEAVSLLVAELKGEAIPPDPEEHAVELLGWLELPLDDAPAVVLTGVNDRHIPESMGADPFLPGALRSHLGIPDDAARYARDAYLLSALTHGREELHLVAGRLTAAGDPLRPSRLLFAAPDEEVARRVRRFLGDGRTSGAGGGSAGGSPTHRGDETPPAGPASQPPPPLSRFRSPPVDPIPPLDALPRMRVTDFAAYLADPYRFALTRILRLDPLEDGGREMEGTTFGSLAHLVLERFGVSEEAASSDPRVVEKKLDRLLDGAIHEEFGRRPVPAVRVQGEQLRARLRGFARWQAAWAGAGWRIRAVESQPEPGVVFDVDGETVLLRGKIDRIDHNPETGEWAVFDYKTGDGGRDPEKAHRTGRGQNRRWVDLQLPLYRRLLSEVRGEDGAPVVPPGRQAGVMLGYLLLPRKLEEVGAAFAQWTEGELAEAEEVARNVVRDLRRKPFLYDPGSRSFRDDPLDGLLGRKELPSAGAEDEGGDE